MQSSLPSPSLRAISQQLHPRSPASYFPPVSAQAFSSPTHNYSPTLPSPRITKTNPPHAIYPKQNTVISHSPIPTRRPTIRQTAIPLSSQGIQATRAIHTLDAGDSGRRRPSFRIDLPPRAMPCGQDATIYTSRYTPQPANPETVPRRCSTPYSVDAQSCSVKCGEPFVDNEYIILGPSANEIEPDFLRSSSTHSGPRTGMVGLGYSLNRMRAPTPWIRGVVEDSEWLTQEV